MTEQATRFMQLQNTVLNMITSERVSGRKWSVEKMAKEMPTTPAIVLLHDQHKFFDVSYVCRAIRLLDIPDGEILKLAQTQGEKVRVARWTLGLTQTALAKQLNTQGSYISNIELGKKTIEDYADLMKIEDIAKALFVDVDWLKSKEPKPEQTAMKIETPVQEELIKEEPPKGEIQPESYSITKIRYGLGKVIHDKRVEMGLSEFQLAADAQISAAELGAIEDGRVLNPNKIPSVLEALGIDRNTLLKHFIGETNERVTAAFITQNSNGDEVSKKAGMSRTSFCNIRNGSRLLYKGEVGLLAAALGVSAKWLKTGNGEPIETKEATAPISKAEPIIQKRKEEITVNEPLFEVEVRERDNDPKGVTFANLNSNDLVTLMNLASKCGILAFAVTAE